MQAQGDSRKFLRTRESKCHSHLKEEQDGDPANCRLVNFTLFLRKVMQKVILRTIFKHMMDKKANLSSEWEFTKGK